VLVQGIALALQLAAGAGAVGVPRIAGNPDLPPECNASTVRRVPIETGGRLFEYRYAYRPADDGGDDQPVVVNIPGGPGEGSIGRPLSVPWEFGIVRIDPLGAGCNANAAISADSLTSEDIASAVLAVVRDIKPKRYILYGVSYGSVVATIAAAKAREAGVPQPDAVVLEAVLGRAFQPDEALWAFENGWNDLKSRLPPGAVDALSQDPPPFGVAPEIWGGYLEYLQLYGAPPGGGTGFAVDSLSALDPAAPEDKRQVLRNQLNAFAGQHTDAAHAALYRSIVCRELDGSARGQLTDFALRGGALIPLDPGFCGPRKMTSAFDAAAYQVEAPLFYFSGGQDPATPEFQTAYHYVSQRSARKTWVRVPTGGHLSFSGNLMDCQEALWKDIAADGGARFASILSSCLIRPSPSLAP